MKILISLEFFSPPDKRVENEIDELAIIIGKCLAIYPIPKIINLKNGYL